MKIGIIMIFITDLSKAKEFYCDILSFSLKAETANRLEFVYDGCDFIAFKCEKESSIEDYGKIARSVFAFEVESVVEKMNELRSNGVHFLHKIPAENEFARYAAFSDPFGNVHEIFERK